MSDSRKAGSEEFKKKFRDGVEERKGTEWYENAAKAGMQEPHVGKSGTKRYSGAEVRAEVRAGNRDADYFWKLKEQGAKFNGNAQDFLHNELGMNIGKYKKGSGKSKAAPDEEAPIEEIDTPTNEVINDITEDETRTPGTPGDGGSLLDGMIQNVIQDNDITTTIDGDNNEVTNTQDNSVSQSMGSSDYAARAARGLKDQYVLDLIRNK